MMGWYHLMSSMVFALADSCWMAAILWLVYQVLSRIFPLQSTHLYRLGFLLVIVLTIGWLFAFSGYFFMEIPPAYYTLTELLPSTAFNLPDWLIDVLAAFYAVGLTYHVLIYLRANRLLQQLRKEGITMPVYWQQYLSSSAASMGIHRSVQIYLSNQVASPLTFGWLQPIILLPVALVNRLSVEEMQAILLHELAHIKRNDFLHQRILIWMEMLLFFNPFARLLFRQIRSEREKCCDDTVIQQGMPVLPYVTALTWCARNSQYMGGTLAITGKENELLVRVKRITHPTTNQSKPDIRSSILAFVLLALFSQFDISVQKKSAGTPTTYPVAAVSKTAVVLTNYRKPQPNVKQTVAFRQSKKNNTVKRNKWDENFNTPVTESPITENTWIQSVRATDQPDLRSVLQDFRNIQHLPSDEVVKLITAALENFNPEEQREWRMLLRKRMFQQQYTEDKQDSLLHFIPLDALDKENTTLVETLLQRKLLWLIWSKWQEKHSPSFERLLHRVNTDSLVIEKDPIQ